jgi:hypothetical protein
MVSNTKEYMREYMRKYRASGRDKTQPWQESRPFVGIDGEGGNLETGYHAYFLLRAGNKRLLPSEGNARLTTVQCLDFLTSLDPHPIYVGYFFDYDVTKILEDLGWTKLDRLIHRDKRAREDGKGVFPVSYGMFEVDYLPRKEFKVRRTQGEDTKWRVFNDVGSFFQCRFVEAIAKWDIGTEKQRELIGVGKEGRANFSFADIESIDEYNAMEIVLLEELMEKFRAACLETGYTPARWQGPGLLAEAMLSKHGVQRTRDISLFNTEAYEGLLTFARNAFYGGRPEIMGVGPVNRVVHQFDINSAYPYAMQFVPCLVHGKWKRKRHGIKGQDFERGKNRVDNLRLVYGTFEAHPTTKDRKRPMWYGLPLRTKDGAIVYPAAGRGWYWSFEVDSAIHQRFTVFEEWSYTRHCQCEPLGFVRDVYLSRQRMGKDAAGTVLKLGLNSLYGKCVQSVGSPKYANPIWGSFITAWCRSMIQDFIHGSEWCKQDSMWCGKDVLMIATDSVCTFNERLDISPSKDLGGWSVETHPRGMFLVQPGLYFGTSGKASKTRGVPRSVIETREQDFRDAFDRMVESRHLADGDIVVDQRMFVGIRYALHRHNLKLLGQWIEFTDPETGRTGKTIRFDWRSKRAPWPVLNPMPGAHDYIETFPQDGSVDTETLPYSKDIGGLVLRDSLRKLFEDQPDWMAQIEPVSLDSVDKD